MTSWTVIFLVLTLLAAFTGFAGVAEEGELFAKAVFVVAFLLTVVSLALGIRAKAPSITKAAA